jgi:hypothetical protein
MDDKEKRFVDELLDASLRRYASTEPRPGLEGRVLAGVRARQQAARRRTVWAWGMGLAAVAAMVTLLLIYWPRQQPEHLPVIANRPANISAPAVARVIPRVQPPLPRQPVRPAAPSMVDTRPQQFPTPRPLSEQEKLLLAYAKSLNGSSDASAPQADMDVEHDLEIPPISIAAIKIEPLAPLENIGDAK